MEENNANNLREELLEISKKSLIKPQYSCCGLGNRIEDEEYVPIVKLREPTKVNPEPENTAY